jgi:methionyl-tRNA formyltransferase
VSGAAAEDSSAGRAPSDSTAATPSAAAPAGSSVSTVFFGSGGFAVPILDALVTIPGIRVAAVVSAPDRPSGRKAVSKPTPVTARARGLGLVVVQPVRVRRPEAIAELRELAPDLIVLADYGQLIPKALLDLPRRGFLNLHPSALPRHRGAAPIPATILAGDSESAVTLMVVTEQMDAGPIVAVEPLQVQSDDTAVTLEERGALAAARLLRRALPEWLDGRLTARPQPAEGVTMTRPLSREDGHWRAGGTVG